MLLIYKSAIPMMIKALRTSLLGVCYQCFKNRRNFASANVRWYSKDPFEDIPVTNIRNFCIIAHVDHGKSTLADRLLEMTGAIQESSDNKQVLDRLPVERERGITVKAVAVSLLYSFNDTKYLLNLIDTPGHVDFSNEVNRSLSACQGAILLIDANEGIQAQTVANFYSAFTREMTIIPAVNKIDLKNANPDKVIDEMTNLFSFDRSSVLRISGKTGLGVSNLLETIVKEIPHPKVNRDPPFKALIIDSWYNQFRGAMAFIYVANGEVKVEDEICSLKMNKDYLVKSVGLLTPEERPITKLQAGQVGIISCNMKSIKEAVIGDTLFSKGVQVEPLQDFEPPKAMVYSGLFPKDQSEYLDLKNSLEKLCLNDPSVSVSVETSPAFGYGWRLGFLGLLHLDVFRQRLEQEYSAETISTAPSVTYKVKIIGEKNIKKYGGNEIEVKNPLDYPEEQIIEETYEPYVTATVITPLKYYQKVADLCLERRGEEISSTCLNDDRLLLKYMLPLSEIIIDFHDVLKRMSSGYASFDYEDSGYRKTIIKKVVVLLNGKEVEELTVLVHASRARNFARSLVDKLKETIPRQQFRIAVQAAIGGTVLAREDIKPFRKDVTAKLYGGDVTRRMKLLKNQAEGKKKMRSFGNILIPKDAFIEALRPK